MTEPKRRPGRPPLEKRTTARIDVLVEPELRHAVRIAAAASDIHMGGWVKQALREKLEREGREVSAE